MIYNDFHGDRLSRLGFGCMRFAKDAESGKIDQNKVNAMFDMAISNGVNYFDTAYPYLDGNSELAMAEALSKYPRDSYYIADKFPGHSLPGPVDNIGLFNISLEKCRTDYFDYYLLHNINEWSIKVYEDEAYHIIPDMIKMKEKGKIRHFGFSFHGGNDMLVSFLDKYGELFDFVQIQCNWLDWTMQYAKEKYEILTERGLGVWVMEPVRGGKLASIPDEYASKLRGMNPGMSDASYAFRFLMGLENVKMILSGMNEVSQVSDNLSTFEKFNPLSQEEEQELLAVAEKLKNGVPCTSCRYCCSKCPAELNIPYLMECYNSIKYGKDISYSMRIDGLTEDKRPSACIGCGQCSKACPQGIDVKSVMAELAEMYEKNPKWGNVAKSRHEQIKNDLGKLH